jgi:5-methylthioribose kinase
MARALHCIALHCTAPNTGSIMVTPDETWVIDPEFAYVGPMAFDVAKILANLLLALFASYGQEEQSGQSRGQQQGSVVQLVHCVSRGVSPYATQLGQGSDVFPFNSRLFSHG